MTALKAALIGTPLEFLQPADGGTVAGPQIRVGKILCPRFYKGAELFRISNLLISR